MFILTLLFLLIRLITFNQEHYTFSLTAINVEYSNPRKLHFTPKLRPKLEEDIKLTLYLDCGEEFSAEFEINFEKEKIISKEKNTYIELPDKYLEYDECIFTLSPDLRIAQWSKRLPDRVVGSLLNHEPFKPIKEKNAMFLIGLGLRKPFKFSIPITIPIKEYILHTNHPCIVFRDFTTSLIVENNTLINIGNFHTFKLEGNKYKCENDTYRVLLLDPNTYEVVYSLIDVIFNTDDLITISLELNNPNEKKEGNVIKGNVKITPSITNKIAVSFPDNFNVTISEKSENISFNKNTFDLGGFRFLSHNYDLTFEALIKDVYKTQLIEPIIESNMDISYILIKQPEPFTYTISKQIIECEIPDLVLTNKTFNIVCKTGTKDLTNIEIILYFYSVDNKNETYNFIIENSVISNNNKEMVITVKGKKSGDYKVIFELNGLLKDMFIVSEDTNSILHVVDPTKLVFKTNTNDITMSNKECIKLVKISTNKAIEENIKIGLILINNRNGKRNIIKLNKELLIFGKDLDKEREFNVELDLESIKHMGELNENYTLKFELQEPESISSRFIVELPSEVNINIHHIIEEEEEETGKEKEEEKGKEKDTSKDNVEKKDVVNENESKEKDFEIKLIKLGTVKRPNQKEDLIIEQNEKNKNNYNKNKKDNNGLKILIIIVIVFILVSIYRRRNTKTIRNAIPIRNTNKPNFY